MINHPAYGVVYITIMAEVAVRNDGKYDESRENLKGRNFDDVASQNGDVEVLVTNGVSKFVVQPGGKSKP